MFYRDVLMLDVMFQKSDLTCFAMGDTYLMVEIDDVSEPEATRPRDRTCLRMNVADVKAELPNLEQHGIEFAYSEHDWGTIAKFRDPDGNLIAFKDSPTFEALIS